LKSHWQQLAAIDFTSLEVWSKGGLVTYYLLFAMRLATRQVCFLGCTPHPVGSWMAQMARNLTDAFEGFLRAPVRYVLLDRDAKFTAQFQEILRMADVKPVLLPPQSPNCNAHLERFFRTLPRARPITRGAGGFGTSKAGGALPTQGPMGKAGSVLPGELSGLDARRPPARRQL
jgi:transposase InsO family protein